MLIYLLISIGFLSCKSQPSQEQIDLSGSWQFKIDSTDSGVNEKWHLNEFAELIRLPGSMKENGFGNEPSLESQWTGSIYDSSWFYKPQMAKYRTEKPLKFPFWLSPELQYLGPAWYQKIITIPENWSDKEIELFLERPHWETMIWIDSFLISKQNSLSTPHRIILPEWIDPGKHSITIRVDNRLDEINVGPDSHSVSDHTQGNWNGIVGDIKLISSPKIFIRHIQIYPDPENSRVKAVVFIKNNSDFEGDAVIELRAESISPSTNHKSKTIPYDFRIEGKEDSLHLDLPMGRDFLTWDEFNPNLYILTAKLKAGNFKHNYSESFGMRTVKVEGKQILINNRPVFLRGNVDCCVFPLTGYPPTDLDSWLKVFNSLKSFGLNHVRFHSWCPPEAAFDAADKLGIYLQPEGPSWANHGTSLGNGRPIDKYIYEEAEKIIDAYGNHPSFCMFAYGNEPRGNYVAYLEDFLKYWKKKDARRIYTGASIGGSWKECQENEFHVKGGARGLPWKRLPNSNFNYENNIKRFEVPFITHELGQYCVFPDFSEIDKYTGSYKAYNFELFKESLELNNMGNQAKDFLLASGELQKICYKYEMEASLKTKGMVGYQLLGLNDFPGQGTALVGVLNAFYEPKPYASEEYFREFCNPVTLLTSFPKFVFKSSEEISVGLSLVNYGQKEIRNQEIEWLIKSGDGTEYAKGIFNTGIVPLGESTNPGDIIFNPGKISKASALTLECRMGEILNHWNFWVYPENLPSQENKCHITDVLNEEALEILNSGGNVLLLASGKIENGKDVIQYFTPVFWNTSWFKMRPPHTTGVLIKEQHPVFNHFPTSFHSDLQWWEVLNRQQVMNLENFPPDFRPLVQPIDTWFLNRRLGLLWEAKSGNGNIMVCSADLMTDQENRPAARQLLYSIVEYIDSPEFEPEIEVSTEIIKELFIEKDREMIDLFTKGSPDELKPKHSEK